MGSILEKTCNDGKSIWRKQPQVAALLIEKLSKGILESHEKVELQVKSTATIDFFRKVTTI